jgi:hypothetical protein
MPFHTGATWSIEYILRIYSSEKNNLVIPPWKRSWTWDSAHGLTLMQGLIESIFSNRKIPEIVVVYDKLSEKYILDDGRHRIETLVRFVDNLFPIEFGGHAVFFKDLGAESTSIFLNYEIGVKIENCSLVHCKKAMLREI